MRLRVRTHGKLCALGAAICVLRSAAKYTAGRSTGRSTQIAALRPHGFYVCVRAKAFMFILTQHASEIAGNSVALLVEIQRKLKYVQLGAACGPRQSMNQSSQFTHSTFSAACGKV